MKNLKTLTGIHALKLPEVLDRPLPNSAYKVIPGGANLTDIDASWQRRAFNSIFGLYGIGWGFDFIPENVDVRNEPNKNGKMESLVRIIGHFWFILTDGKENRKVSYPVTGGNGSYQNEGYALKGAVTNAISFGASMIGWQESVYMGIRTHKNPQASVSRNTVEIPKEKLPEFPPEKPESKPEPKSKPAVTKKAYTEPEKKSEPEPKSEPAITKKTEPEKPRFFLCAECSKTYLCEVGELVHCPECHAGNKSIIEVDSIEDGIQKASEMEEKKSLAEDSGFDNIKYPVCTQCGWGEPVNNLPPACPTCGVVAEQSFSMSKNHEHFKTMKSNIEKKITAAKAKENVKHSSKEALDTIKKLCDNDRRSILQHMSESTGREITGYSQLSVEEMQACIEHLKSKGKTVDSAAATATVKKDKVQLTREIYSMAHNLGYTLPKHIIAKISELSGKDVKTATALNEDELAEVYRKLQAEAKEKGQ